MTVARRFFRFLALALATAQIVVSVGAPVLEGALAAAQMRNTVTADTDAPQHGAPAHDPRTCAVCQLISSVAPPPQPTTIPVPCSEIRGRVIVAADLPSQNFRRTGVLSRAPPTLPA